MYILTTATKKLLKLKKRIRGVAGGTSAGKTISILQILIDQSQSDKTPKLTSVVSESFPHLKRGAMRDFLNIMKDHDYYKESSWNRTDSIYTFETGSKIEFFSADSSDKVRGPRRDRLFINEANNITQETFEQLEIRTKEDIWLDWNPTYEYWFYLNIKQREDTDFIILTYKDNEGLPDSIVESIESRRDNKNWWTVYGEGKLGVVEGRIYSDWKIINDIPHGAELIKRGLDFGFAQDPSALVDVYRYDGGFILDERLYRTGMFNRDIATFINSLDQSHALVIADSAEPKAIAEIKQTGVNILPIVKTPNEPGKSFRRSRVESLRDKRISVTSGSLNLLQEYRSYMWKTDRDGKIVPEPEDGNDHLLNAAEYALYENKVKPTLKVHKPRKMVERKYRL